MARRMGDETKAAKRGRSAKPADDIEEFSGKLPDQATLDAFLAEMSKLDSKGASIRGEIGALVKAGEADSNIHRGVGKLVHKLMKMDDTKCAEFLRHFDHYRAFYPKLDAQPDLFDSKDAAPARNR